MRFWPCIALCPLLLAACSDGGGTLTPGGDPSEGRVASGDSAQPSGWAASVQADVWHIALTAANPVTILMCSSMPNAAFDPFLQLDFQGETVASDDDSAGNLNARIVYTPTTSGTYDLYAMARGGTAPAGGGAYTVRVFDGAMLTASCPTGTSP